MARVEYRQTFHRSAHTDDALLAPSPHLSRAKLSEIPRAAEIPTQSLGLRELLDRFLRVNLKPTSISPVNTERVARTAFNITATFESGGKLDALQTVDSGVISYGRHQATLASGSLAAVIERFCAISDSAAVGRFAKYSERLTGADSSLRTDRDFLKLLKDAAKDDPTSMRTAQDEVFGRAYWRPSVALTDSCGLTSPLAKAIFFDTKVQGGCEIVLRRTVTSLIAQLKSTDLGKSGVVPNTATAKGAAKTLRELLDKGLVTENQALATFIGERKRYVIGVAEGRKKAGDRITANALIRSTEYRGAAFLTLLAQGNLDLKGPLVIRGSAVPGTEH